MNLLNCIVCCNKCFDVFSRWNIVGPIVGSVTYIYRHKAATACILSWVKTAKNKHFVVDAGAVAVAVFVIFSKAVHIYFYEHIFETIIDFKANQLKPYDNRYEIFVVTIVIINVKYSYMIIVAVYVVALNVVHIGVITLLKRHMHIFFEKKVDKHSSYKVSLSLPW